MKVKTKKKIKALVPRPQNISLGKNCLCDSSRFATRETFFLSLAQKGEKNFSLKKTHLIHRNHMKWINTEMESWWVRIMSTDHSTDKHREYMDLALEKFAA